MKHEFEELVGHAVSDDCYQKIEYVYLYKDFFKDKQSIVKFYKAYDMNGIESVYSDILEHEKVEHELQNAKMKIHRLEEHVENLSIENKKYHDIENALKYLKGLLS